MSRKRWLWAGAIALGIVVLAGGAAYALRDSFTFANLATGYAAKQTCSCVHVSGRPLESCLADFPDAASREQLNVAEDGNVVRASALFGIFHAEAVYEEGYGCRIID